MITSRKFLIIISSLLIVAGRSKAQDRLSADFLAAPAAALDLGWYGYFNPALASTLTAPEAFLFYSPATSSGVNSGMAGFFSGLPHLQFGCLQRPGSSPLPDYSGGTLRDYRLSLGLGERTVRLGVGYSWLRGNSSQPGSREAWLLGALYRPNPFLSVGLATALARHRSDYQSNLELALRPRGNGRLTCFASLERIKEWGGDRWDWSMGALAQPWPGLQFSARWFRSGIVTVGLNIGLGRSSLSAFSQARNPGNPRGTVYGLRLGRSEPDIMDTYFRNRTRYLPLVLPASLVYRKYRFLDRSGPTFYDVISSIRQASEDPRVAGLALHLGSARLSAEQSWELRQELKRFQQKGGKVVVFLEQSGMNLYYLASLADRLVLDPQASLLLPGYALGRAYLKDLLDKMGIGFEEWRFFEYKSALETFSRSSMSSPDREQRLAFLKEWYDIYRLDVSQSRGISPARLDTLINARAFFTAQEALTLGLVDTLARWPATQTIISALCGRNLRPLGKDELNGRRLPPVSWSPLPRIALVYAEGVCDLNKGIQARYLDKILRALARDKQIKAVVLRVDSPGGDGLASDLAAQALKECRKQKSVVVSQGAVAASGGYWLSLYADSILAAPVTLTGSIGVIGGWVWDKGLSSGLGIARDQVKIGDHADLTLGLPLPFLNLPLPRRNLAPDEKTIMEGAMRSMYRDFVGQVASARNLLYAQVQEMAQGRVWSGRAALKNGLVDRLAGLGQALESARYMAGFIETDKTEIVEMPALGLINPELFLPSFSLKSAKEDTDNIFWEYLIMQARSGGRPLYFLPSDWLQLTAPSR